VFDLDWSPPEGNRQTATVAADRQSKPEDGALIGTDERRKN
jgi:hypothetical protein